MCFYEYRSCLTQDMWFLFNIGKRGAFGKGVLSERSITRDSGGGGPGLVWFWSAHGMLPVVQVFGSEGSKENFLCKKGQA